MKSDFFSIKIVEWYQEHHRNLPWRNTQDPYKIWLSEIIMQQTRVLQGLPYYEKFVQNYPNIKSLARAREEQILRLWQGLGYYTRARNLHACAREIVDKHRAKFPTTFEELVTLPGVGDYTAAAIASFAFDERVAVLDGNVFRVLARVFGIDKDITSLEGKKHFARLANQLIPVHNPGVHNQAIMEFGALHCLPQNPKCEVCVLKSRCVAYKHNEQSELPVRAKHKKPKHRYFYYFIIRLGDKIFMNKRNGKDIWKGLYDFPLREVKRAIRISRIHDVLNASSGSRKGKEFGISISPEDKHILSHQVIHARFIVVERMGIKDLDPSLIPSNARAYSMKEVARLPKPVLISRYLEDWLVSPES